jgi:REP element-mobilizing transposase RayT
MLERKSLRLQNWDYRSSGWYYVTICTKNREKIFGQVKNGEMMLSQCGEIVREEWIASETLRKEIYLDEFVIMPNHFHGIVEIRRGVWPYTPTKRGFQSPSKDLGSMIRSFKGSVTKRINEHREIQGCPVWQRNYHDHIIRNDEDLHRIRKYIRDNPVNWQEDEYNKT